MLLLQLCSPCRSLSMHKATMQRHEPSILIECVQKCRHRLQFTELCQRCHCALINCGYLSAFIWSWWADQLWLFKCFYLVLVSCFRSCGVVLLFLLILRLGPIPALGSSRSNPRQSRTKGLQIAYTHIYTYIHVYTYAHVHTYTHFHIYVYTVNPFQVYRRWNRI